MPGVSPCRAISARTTARRQQKKSRGPLRDALSNRSRVLRYLDHLVEGLDEHGVRAVHNAMIGILPIADIERLLKDAQEHAKPKGDEVFDGL